MKRIFLTLAVLSTVLLFVAFGMGYALGDVRSAPENPLIGRHLLVALGVSIFTMLVHSLVFTYFMGTGRWMEDTGRAYSLDGSCHRASQALKYRLLPGIIGSILLLIATGCFGAVADPASPADFQGWMGFGPDKVHFLLASITLLVNVLSFFYEYRALHRNGELVENVLADVRRIRLERGLPV